MKEKAIPFMLFVLSVLLLPGCAQERQNEIVEEKTDSQNVFYEAILCDLNQEITQYANNVKGELHIVLDENEFFPDELVSMIENALYHSVEYNMDFNTPYFDLLKDLGADQFGQETQDCLAMFYFLNNSLQKMRVTLVDNGGSNGAATVYVSKEENNEFLTQYKFEVQNPGYGRVIPYEDEFYYIYLHYNYNLKNYDGVQLFKLGEEKLKGNIMIKYLPKTYCWKNMYSAESEYGDAIEAYVANMQETITSDEYLEKGNVSDISVIQGDEAASQREWNVIDFTNTGMPIYMDKRNLIPSTYRDTWHLRTNFYAWNESLEKMEEVPDYEISENNLYDMQIVQLWFKQFDDKIFTFIVSHVSDYNYMIDVILLEGEKIIPVRKDIFAPKREFVLYEGVDKIR